MLGWWKKTDGFEWREYVRTTILVKRKQRRDRVVEAKVQAVAGAKRAGQASAAASGRGLAALWRGSTRGLKGLGSVVWRGMALGLGWIGTAPRRALAVAGPALTSAQWRLKPMARRLTTPPLRTVLRNGGLVALIIALAWLPGRGLSQETWIAGGIAVALLGGLGLARVIVGERLLPDGLAGRVPGVGWVADRVPAISPKVVGGAVAAVVLALAGGLAWQSWQGGGLPTPSLASLQIPGFSASQKIEGRASAIDGDTLRIGSSIVQLDGIEAPERTQRCRGPGNRSWRCGDAAREALARLTGRKRIVCTVSTGAVETDGSGRMASGTCEVDGADLAETLVRKGYVFAKSGLFARYSAAEDGARADRAGVWRGTGERPQAWRDKLWAEAKRSAPDGCPIKGEVRSGAKVYLLPWSPRYERAKVSSRRGERWFCTEAEAQEAGWRPRERS